MKYAEILTKQDEDMLGDKESIFFYLRKKQAISPLTYGLKFHLSIKADQVEAAWDCIEDLLIDDDSPFDSLKVIDTSESCDDSEGGEEKQRMLRLTQGIQFTLYVHGHATQPTISETKLADIAKLLQAIDTRLADAGIEPGIIPTSDHPMSRYVSARYATNDSLYIDGLHSTGEHNWRIAKEIEAIASQNAWPIEPIRAFDPTAAISFHHLIGWHEILQQESRGWLTATQQQSLLAQSRLVLDSIVNSSDPTMTDFERLTTLEFTARLNNSHESWTGQNSYEQMIYNLTYSDYTIGKNIKKANKTLNPYLSQLADIYNPKLIRQHMQFAFPENDTKKFLWDGQFREKLFFPPYLYYFIKSYGNETADETTKTMVTHCSEKSFAIDVIRVSLKTGLDPKLAQMIEATPVIKDSIYKRELEIKGSDCADELMLLITKQAESTKAEAALAMTKETTELMGPGHPF
ncbi:MAG: hypothetical protein P1U63_05195 [Coxiellaceae bacterium]|nr:hypothetical protein [Coxiellaceae bacterium]